MKLNMKKEIIVRAIGVDADIMKSVIKRVSIRPDTFLETFKMNCQIQGKNVNRMANNGYCYQIVSEKELPI